MTHLSTIYYQNTGVLSFGITYNADHGNIDNMTQDIVTREYVLIDNGTNSTLYAVLVSSITNLTALGEAEMS
jgi:hypothetical protein